MYKLLGSRLGSAMAAAMAPHPHSPSPACASSLVLRSLHSNARSSLCGGRRRAPSLRACLSTAAEDGSSAESSSGRSSFHSPPRFSVAPMMDWTDHHYRTLARLISKRAWLYTEMVVADTINHQQDNLDKILKFSEAQHPIVLQLGGSSPEKLLKATQLASVYGYDEINLNCGCPSDKVAGHGCFGASLMLEPELVGQSMAAIADGSPGTPVTVKCRIGVDDFDSYELLYKFIATVSSMSPTQHFIIHSRKAILKGLSPAANRTVPPLKYEYVYALIRDFPDLNFTLNGGIVNVHQVNEALQMGVHGVMLGRAAYNNPWGTLGNVDSVVYGETASGLTRRQILEEYVEYADAELHKYGQKKPSVRHLVKPLLHLFHSEAGAGVWRRAIDESLRHSETVRNVLKETLLVLPDSVLDSPPPLEPPAGALFSDLATLPLAPLSSSFGPSQSLELSSSVFLDERLLVCVKVCIKDMDNAPKVPLGPLRIEDTILQPSLG